MSEAKKEFYLRLKDDSVDVKAGQDIRFEADASTISGIVTGIGTVATTSLGVNGCLALGGAAAGALSIYLIGKIINKKWPYAKISGVKENNVIQVSVPSEKEGTFDDLVKKKKLQKVLQNEFEDIEDNLEGILEEEAYKTYGTQVLDIVRKIRVASITQSGTSVDLPDGAIGNYIAPGAEDKKVLTDVSQLIAAKRGTAIGNYVGPGATADYTINRGNVNVLAGYDAPDVEKIAQADRKIFVTVNFPEHLSPKFEQKFQPNDKIINVRSALKEDRKKLYFLVREKQPGAILPNSLPVVDIKDDLLAYENKDEALKVEN